MIFGQRRPLEAPALIKLSEGESFTANVALTRGGAIRGRIVDEFGEPIAGTRLQVLRSRMVRGQRRLQSMGPGDQTDDMGEFRVYGLPPGDYYVTASTGPADSGQARSANYYPGPRLHRSAKHHSRGWAPRHPPTSSSSRFAMRGYPGSSSTPPARPCRPRCSCRQKRSAWVRLSSRLATRKRSRSSRHPRDGRFAIEECATGSVHASRRTFVAGSSQAGRRES